MLSDRRMRLAVRLLLAFLFTLVPVLLYSSKPTIVTWDGGGADNAWSTAENWSTDRVPDAENIVTFNATNTKDVVIDTDVNVEGFYITADYPSTIQVRSGKRISIGSDGFKQLNGSFVAAGAPVDIWGGFDLQGGTFTAPSSTLTVKKSFRTSGGKFEPNNGTVVLNGKQIDVQ